MSVPVTVTITGCDSMAVSAAGAEGGAKLQAARSQQKMAILQKTAPVAMQGKFEAYKSSQIYDGTFNNPQWLG